MALRRLAGNSCVRVQGCIVYLLLKIDAARFSELCENVADNKQTVVLSTPRFRRIIQRSTLIVPSPLRALSCAS